MAFTVVECDADGFDSIFYEFKDFCDDVHMSVL